MNQPPAAPDGWRGPAGHQQNHTDGGSQPQIGRTFGTFPYVLILSCPSCVCIHNPTHFITSNFIVWTQAKYAAARTSSAGNRAGIASAFISSVDTAGKPQPSNACRLDRRRVVRTSSTIAIQYTSTTPCSQSLPTWSRPDHVPSISRLHE